MPAHSGCYRSAGLVRIRSISDLSCDLHDELATLLRKTILEDEGQLLYRRFGASRTPLRQALGVLFADALVHLWPSQEHDLGARHPPGPAISGKNNTNLDACAKLASAPTVRQSLQLKPLEPTPTVVPYA